MDVSHLIEIDKARLIMNLESAVLRKCAVILAALLNRRGHCGAEHRDVLCTDGTPNVRATARLLGYVELELGPIEPDR
jgi:hypothetical protein